MAAHQPAVIQPWLLVCFFLAVLAAWIASLTGLAPVFLVRPPITRRTKFYAMPEYKGCTSLVQRGAWTDFPLAVNCNTGGYATCGPTVQRRWAFSWQAEECGARRYGRQDIRELLGGKWVVFAGDSVTRMLAGAILRVAGSPGQEVKTKHQDFEYTLEGNIRMTFLWRAYPTNLTEQYEEWQRTKEAPDLIFSSVSLWHLLWVTDATVFSRELLMLGRAAKEYVNAVKAPPQLFLASTTDTFTNRQPTRIKRQNMTPGHVDEYNKAMAERTQLLRTKGGPFELLDLFTLTRGCGEECSFDGIHSVDAVYDTALQLLLNLNALGKE